MFDFTPVGVGLAVAGLIFLAFGYRLLPRGRKGAASMDAAFNIEGYTTEATSRRIRRSSARPSSALVEAGENEIEVVIADARPRPPLRSDGHTVLKAGDIVLLQGEPEALERVVGRRSSSSPATRRARRSTRRPTRSA